jgi:hypothetical protein
MTKLHRLWTEFAQSPVAQRCWRSRISAQQQVAQEPTMRLRAAVELGGKTVTGIQVLGEPDGGWKEWPDRQRQPF